MQFFRRHSVLGLVVGVAIAAAFHVYQRKLTPIIYSPALAEDGLSSILAPIFKAEIRCRTTTFRQFRVQVRARDIDDARVTVQSAYPECGLNAIQRKY